MESATIHEYLPVFQALVRDNLEFIKLYKKFYIHIQLDLLFLKELECELRRLMFSFPEEVYLNEIYDLLISELEYAKKNNMIYNFKVEEKTLTSFKIFVEFDKNIDYSTYKENFIELHKDNKAIG